MRKRAQTIDAELIAALAEDEASPDRAASGCGSGRDMEGRRRQWQEVLGSLDPYRLAAQKQSEHALAWAVSHAEKLEIHHPERRLRLPSLGWVGALAACICVCVAVIVLRPGVGKETTVADGTVYVDFAGKQPGTGTPEAPCTSLSDAMQLLSGRPATLHILPGSSPEKGLRIEKSMRIEALNGCVQVGALNADDSRRGSHSSIERGTGRADTKEQGTPGD